MSIRFGRSGNGYDSSQVMETADDDWRQITDLAERRKIQNRLAQRNYRRKLRQRLEELERRAGVDPSSATSTPPTLQLPRPRQSGRVQKAPGRGRSNSSRSEHGRLQVPVCSGYEQDPMSATTASSASPVTPFEYPQVGPNVYPVDLPSTYPRYSPEPGYRIEYGVESWGVKKEQPEEIQVCLPPTTSAGYMAEVCAGGWEVPQQAWWEPTWEVTQPMSDHSSYTCTSSGP